MATWTKFQQCIEDVYHKVHNYGSDQFSLALCAAANAPSASAHAVLTDLTTVSLANLVGDANVTTSSSGQTGGTYTLALTDKVLTAGAGGVGPFRYVVLYNNTPTSPADPLVAYYDYGSEITLAEDETLTVDFAASSFTAT